MNYDFAAMFAGLTDPTTIGMMLVGCIGGIIIGAIPGLSGSTGIILLLPLIYKLDMVPALVVMAGMFCGTMYGGSLPAILIQAPGTPSAAATSLNGYPLAQAGKAGKAITVALVASVIGGLASGVCLMFVSPFLARFALKFQAPEYFALALFGLTLIASSGGNFIKGLISGFVGLLLSCIGVDVITGSSRFTFGTTILSGGVGVLPLLVGLFAMAQVLIDVTNRSEPPRQEKNFGSFMLSLEEWKMILLPMLVAAVTGIVIGIAPGAGGAIACFMGYELSKKVARRPDLYGKGSIEGLAASECANNATTGGAMIPLITLGVPGDAVTAVMLGAFMLVGIKPGPTLFQEYGTEMQTFFLAFIVMQLVILVLGGLGTGLWIKILSIPRSILMPAVLLFCFLGAYSLAGSTRDAVFALAFSILGYFMKKFQYPAPPLILGLILGSMAEQNLNRTLMIHQSWTVLFTRPISAVLMIISVFTVVWSMTEALRTKMKEKKRNETKS